MIRHRLRSLDARGFTAAELIVVLAIVGGIAAVSVPMLLNSYQPSPMEAAVEEVAAALYRGRQLSIANNRHVCFQAAGNQYQYAYGCGGPAIVLPGADASGVFRLANNAIITNGGVNPVFDYLGAAPTPATLTVTYVGPGGAESVQRSVVISRSGRIQAQ